MVTKWPTEQDVYANLVAGLRLKSEEYTIIRTKDHPERIEGRVEAIYNGSFIWSDYRTKA
jgi:hypothetical protein